MDLRQAGYVGNSQVDDMKVCPGCGATLAAEALFCPNDGTALARAEHDLFLGTVVADHFLVMEQIGKGTSGTVYRAENLHSRHDVALKVFGPTVGTGDRVLERARQVVEALAQIPNDHHTKILETGLVTGGNLYVEMELLSGETLASRLKRETLTSAQAIDLVWQIAEGLTAVHARGWAHAELHPNHVVFVPHGGRTDFVKLLDLGLAQLTLPATEGGANGFARDARYVPPELMRNELPDPRSDVYALGVLAVNALMGEAAFSGSRIVPKLADRIPDLPPHVEAVVARALAQDREARWQDAMALASALQQPAEMFRPQTAPYLHLGVEVAPVPLPQTLTETFPRPPTPLGAKKNVEVDNRPTPSFSFSAMTQIGIPVPPVPEVHSVAKPSVAPVVVSESRSPLDEREAAGASGVWFSDGELASQAAEGKIRPRTGQLPALYERLQQEQEEESHVTPRSRSKMAMLGAVAGVVAVVFLVFAFTKGEVPAEQALPETPAASAPQQPSAPVPRPENPLAPAAPSVLPVEISTGPSMAAPLADPVFQPLPGQLPPTPSPSAPPPSVEVAAVPLPAAAPPVFEPPPHPQPPAHVAPPPKPRPATVVEPERPRLREPNPQPVAPPEVAPARSSSSKQASDFVRAGREQLRRGNYVLAGEEFEKARQLEPSNAEALAGLGEVAFEQGYYAQAVERLRVAVRLRPRSVHYLVLLGNAYFKTGQARSAVEQYKRALDISPGNEEAQSGLQAAEKRLGGG